MNTHLFRVSKVCWAIKSVFEPEVRVFRTIEQAADYLMSINVLDEHIDTALIDMYANETIHASFGEDGKFVESDNEKLDGILGVA